MKRKWTVAAALSGLLLLPVAGCPFINPPPDPPNFTDLGELVRARLTDRDESEPIDIEDDAEFDTDDEQDDFADVLTDPQFGGDRSLSLGGGRAARTGYDGMPRR